MSLFLFRLETVFVAFTCLTCVPCRLMLNTRFGTARRAGEDVAFGVDLA